MYVIRKEKQYCCLAENNRVDYTENITLATKFNTIDEAFKILHRATKKLKGFKVEDLNTGKEIKYIAKCKRQNFSSEQRMDVYNRGEGICAICGKFVAADEFTLDHIIPLAKGGVDTLENLQCTHRVCNQVKQDILPEDLMDKLSEIVLYQMEKNYDEEFYKKIRYVRRKKITGGILKWIFG